MASCCFAAQWFGFLASAGERGCFTGTNSKKCPLYLGFSTRPIGKTLVLYKDHNPNMGRFTMTPPKTKLHDGLEDKPFVLEWSLYQGRHSFIFTGV